MIAKKFLLIHLSLLNNFETEFHRQYNNSGIFARIFKIIIVTKRIVFLFYFKYHLQLHLFYSYIVIGKIAIFSHITQDFMFNNSIQTNIFVAFIDLMTCYIKNVTNIETAYNNFKSNTVSYQ